MVQSCAHVSCTVSSFKCIYNPTDGAAADAQITEAAEASIGLVVIEGNRYATTRNEVWNNGTHQRTETTAYHTPNRVTVAIADFEAQTTNTYVVRLVAYASH